MLFIKGSLMLRNKRSLSKKNGPLCSQKKGSFFSESKELLGVLLIVFIIRSFGFGLYEVPSGSMETTMLVGERFFANKFTPLFLGFKHLDIISMNEPIFTYSPDTLKWLWQKYVWGPANWTKRVIGIPGDKIRGAIENGKAVIYRNGIKLDEPYVNKYPLIGIYKKAQPEAYEEICHEFSNMTNDKNQELLQQITSQFFYEYCTLRSYDPSVPYDEQPFYKISNKSIFKKFCNDGPLLVCADSAVYHQPKKVVQRGSSYWSESDEFYIELENNEYWLMGDNRRGSFDSRFFGPVKDENIHGKIIFRILSVEYNPPISNSSSLLLQAWNWINTILLVRIIQHPISFWKKIRWNRCLQRIS